MIGNRVGPGAAHGTCKRTEDPSIAKGAELRRGNRDRVSGARQEIEIAIAHGWNGRWKRLNRWRPHLIARAWRMDGGPGLTDSRNQLMVHNHLQTGRRGEESDSLRRREDRRQAVDQRAVILNRDGVHRPGHGGVRQLPFLKQQTRRWIHRERQCGGNRHVFRGVVPIAMMRQPGRGDYHALRDGASRWQRRIGIACVGPCRGILAVEIEKHQAAYGVIGHQRRQCRIGGHRDQLRRFVDAGNLTRGVCPRVKDSETRRELIEIRGCGDGGGIEPSGEGILKGLNRVPRSDDPTEGGR